MTNTAKRQPKISHIQRKLIPSYIFLTIMSLISVFPLYWMFTAATNTSLEVAQGKIWFGNYIAENYKNLTAQQDLWQAMGNSFFYAAVQTIATLFICSLAGYGFELYHDKGKDRLFAILLLAMMVPGVATLIPLFTMISKMKLLNTVWAFIIPGADRHLLPDVFPDDEVDLRRGRGHHLHERLELLHVAPDRPEGQRRDHHADGHRQHVQWLGRGLRMLMMGVLFCSIPTMIIFFVLQKQFAGERHHRFGQVSKPAPKNTVSDGGVFCCWGMMITKACVEVFLSQEATPQSSLTR